MSEETQTEDSMTWIEFVKSVRPELNLSDSDAEIILWEESAFPFAEAPHVKEQIRAFVGSIKVPETTP